ncbi:MAG: hypothetical protein OXC62_12185 [Aestuariivita sp.]|nr:hypothetical protein [Aestuariivita sp.]
MISPQNYTDFITIAQRSGRAQQARNRADDNMIDAVDNVGGAWNPSNNLAALQPLDHGWGGWSDSTNPPWKPRHELSMIGDGGIYVRDKHRETIAGVMYQSQVEGNRKVEISGDSAVNVTENMTVSVMGVKSPGDTGGAIKGRETIHVMGGMSWTTGDKILMGTGNVNRRWEGGISRLIGMEGVIAGGAFLKTFTGTSITMTPLASGDVYGGAAQASVARVRVASGTTYRSVELSAWKCGLYLRSCSVVLEPAIGSPAADGARSRAAKMFRLGMGICPAFDIMVGVLMAPVMIAKSIKAMASKKTKVPPKGTPRLHLRVGAVVNQGRSADKIM